MPVKIKRKKKLRISSMAVLCEKLIFGKNHFLAVNLLVIYF